MTRHPVQTTFDVAPDHWVVARRGPWGGFDVVEIVTGASFIHSQHRRREHAEVIAAAVAATRTQPEEDHRG